MRQNCIVNCELQPKISPDTHEPVETNQHFTVIVGASAAGWTSLLSNCDFLLFNAIGVHSLDDLAKNTFLKLAEACYITKPWSPVFLVLREP